MSNKEKIIYKSFIAIGVVLMLYYLILKISFGFIAFSSMFCMLGIALFMYGLIEIKFEINIWGKIPRILRRVITIFFTIAVIIFITI